MISSRLKKPLIIVVIVALLAAGAAVYFYMNRVTEKAEDVLKQYVNSLNERDFKAMYVLLTDESKAKISEEDFIAKNQKIYEGIEAADLGIEIKNIDERSESTELTYQMSMDTLAGIHIFSNKAVFTMNDEKAFRLVWTPEIIYPSLTAEDKIRVSIVSGIRGRILDRNGIVLADNGIASSVGLVPGKLSVNTKEADLANLSQILDVSVESIQKKLSASYVKEDSFVAIKMIAKKDYDRTEKLLEIPGVLITDTKARVYPYAEKTAHLTGYIQNINADDLKEKSGQNYHANSIIGKVGIEKLYEDRLRAVDGSEIFIADQDGNKKRIIAQRQAKNGEDITLTIDAIIQSKLYNHIKTGATTKLDETERVVTEVSGTSDKSSSVVMNYQTGEVLSLISTPSYDPNEFVMGMSSSRWSALNESPDKPMFNRTKATFVPGSSFKPVTAAMGLTTGKLDPNENFGHSGLSWQKDESWGNYKVTTLVDYGSLKDLHNALVYSDNIYFAKAALKIGPESFADQLTKLGFGETMPFEFGLTDSQISQKGKITSEVQLADSGYGQGQLLVNPVHMASVYSAFMNEGNMVSPYLEFRSTTAPEYWKEQVFSKEAVDIVRKELIQVVESPQGTGHSAKTNGITLAGKTGTAEIKATKEDVTGTELGWFNAFTTDAGTSKPFVVIMMVEDVKDRGGSHYVIPIVKSVFE